MYEFLSTKNFSLSSFKFVIQRFQCTCLMRYVTLNPRLLNTHSINRSVLGGTLGTAILKEGFPFAVHYVMFIPTIMGQGTMAQQAYWISRAWNCEIMCTYAQVIFPNDFIKVGDNSFVLFCVRIIRQNLATEHSSED